MYTWIFKTCKISTFLYMFLVKRQKLYVLRRSRYKRNTWQFFVPLYILYASPNDHLSFFPWNETGFQQMTVDLKGAATAVKHRGFRRGTKHLFEVVPVKVGAAHIQKGSGKVVNFWAGLDFRLLFFPRKDAVFFLCRIKTGKLYSWK